MAAHIHAELVREAAERMAAKGMCEGECGAHRGNVRVVHVSGWSYFAYCDEAVAEDRRRELVVTETESEPQP